LAAAVSGSASRREAATAVGASASAARVAAPRPTTLADLPAPKSANAEAQTEFVAGMQLLRDDSYANALRRFERAAELDPSMALAHLRVALTGLSITQAETGRAELAKATELRAQLSDRDRALLDAVEPEVGRVEPDTHEYLARLEAAHDRFPTDEEFLALIAKSTLTDPTRASSTAREAVDLDPLDAGAWETLGRALALGGDVVEGRRALERCAAISVESSDCYLWLGLLDGAAGRCSDMERDARHEADHDPRFGNWSLALASAALDRPESVVREAVSRYLETEPPEERPLDISRYDALLACAAGRFDVALAKLQAASAVLASTSAAKRQLITQGGVAALRVHVLEEIGRGNEARVAARDFIDRAQMLTQGSSTNGGMGPYWWLVRAAGLPLDPPRRTWVEARLGSAQSSAGTWGLAWALPATNVEQAKEAIDMLAKDRRLTPPNGGELAAGALVEVEGAAGRVYLLAGKPAQALPFLRRSASSCLALSYPFEHVQATLDMARALEQTDDRPGACDAYRKVVLQWGHAVPRSVSAEAARDGMKRLKCTP
jgi:serine/threonine-protein kinase